MTVAPTSRSELSLLLSESWERGGVPWRKLTPSVTQLAAKRDRAQFDTICPLAMEDMGRQGLSDSDAALIVYGLAREDHKFNEDELRKIACLTTPKTREALKLVGIAGPMPRVVNTSEDIKTVVDVAQQNFAFPNAVLRGSTPLAPYLDDRIDIAGRLDLLKTAKGERLFATERQDDLSKEAFLNAWKSLASGGKVHCWLEDQQLTQIPSEVASQDRPAALLVRTGGSSQTSPQTVLLFLGLRPKNENGSALIHSIWVGDTRDLANVHVDDVRLRLRDNCKTQPAVADFLNAVVAAPVPLGAPAAVVAPTDAGQLPPPPPPPVPGTARPPV